MKTLLIKGAYPNDEETQLTLNRLVSEVLSCVKTEKQWISYLNSGSAKYMETHWKDLKQIKMKIQDFCLFQINQ